MHKWRIKAVTINSNNDNNIRKVRQKNAQNAKESLKNLEASMKDGDHIRGPNTRIKNTNGTVLINTGKRATKFKQARTTIEAYLTRALGSADEARRIMKPFDNIKRGLTKDDMKEIIADIN